MKTPMVSSATSFQRLQTSLQSPMPRLPRSNVYSTQDPANPSASVHRKRFFTPSLTLKFLCAGYLNRGMEIEGTKANDAEIRPQEIMILAIHRRAPTLSKIKLDGTSKIK